MSLVLPPLYVILDAALLTTSPELDVAKQLTDAGVRLFHIPQQARIVPRNCCKRRPALAAELVPAGAKFSSSTTARMSRISPARAAFTWDNTTCRVAEIACRAGFRQVSRRIHTQSRAIPLGGCHGRRLHRARSRFRNKLKGKSRSRRGDGYDSSSAEINTKTDCGDRRNYVGTRAGSDRSRRRTRLPSSAISCVRRIRERRARQFLDLVQPFTRSVKN